MALFFLIGFFFPIPGIWDLPVVQNIFVIEFAMGLCLMFVSFSAINEKHWFAWIFRPIALLLFLVILYFIFLRNSWISFAFFGLSLFVKAIPLIASPSIRESKSFVEPMINLVLIFAILKLFAGMYASVTGQIDPMAYLWPVLSLMGFFYFGYYGLQAQLKNGIALSFSR